ncbi:hypothetical protein PU629_05180 [Pullulanibacillus sp. KACC 23026]|uniref:hypothetical protein n=1 Tax=Pullulanibacillus sp. KACC 23026 TaxID=3028315 RepID=UPI0023AFD0A6|nr:hypothetical protein [Pullulanibacillus sp. KACC 23026]WEG13761.1 hypothetical protein PU629_05180 [Pullulanibacillus sp. KACC 23026]
MIMEEVQQFIEALEGKTSLYPLYAKKSLTIEFVVQQNRIWMVISNKRHEILKEEPSAKASIVVTAQNEASLEKILRGEQPLLQLCSEGVVQVEGAFNDQLTLESILILGSSHSYLVV